MEAVAGQHAVAGTWPVRRLCWASEVPLGSAWMPTQQPQQYNRCKDAAMADQNEMISRLQEELGPFIKPREQVDYIRRVTAIHLGQSGGDELLKPPFSLVETPDNEAEPATSASRLQQEYREALQANMAARKQFSQVRQNHLINNGSSKAIGRPENENPLEDRIATLKLRQKRDSLFAIQSSLEILSERPAAMEDFLDTEQMFNDVSEMPTVPKEILNTMVIEQTSSPKDLTTTINQLDKFVLKAKLRLKHEEQLLQEAKSKARGLSTEGHQSSKLEALGATRNELINWIETELGNASNEGEGDHDGGDGNKNASGDPSSILAQLNDIQEKYLNYVSMRTQVLENFDNDIAAFIPQNANPPTENKGKDSPAETARPLDHFLTPCVQSLLHTSKSNKGLIAQKSHISSTLAKNKKATSKQISSVSQSSGLLSKYPSTEEEPEHPSHQLDLTNKTKPWIAATESAKITSLEDVAGKLDVGQKSLENSMAALQQLRQLTGEGRAEGQQLSEEQGKEDDTWIGAGYSNKGHARKVTESKLPRTYKRNDMWSKIHGNLGLLGYDGL